MEKWEIGDVCVVCGSPYICHHHIFGGVYRRKVSDRYGYIIPLCVEHHTGQNGIHRQRKLDEYWKVRAQEHFEQNIGTRQDFIRIFGKSWI